MKTNTNTNNHTNIRIKTAATVALSAMLFAACGSAQQPASATTAPAATTATAAETTKSDSAAAAETTKSDSTAAAETAMSESTAAAEKAAENAAATESETAADIITNLPQIDMAAWQYDADNDVYWQTGIAYCETPADESYETLGIFIPGAYMKATANADGTYTCEIDPEGTVAGYTAATAPVVIPVETPGYSAMNPPEGYDSGTAAFTEAGFVYLYAGCRGRNHGAPAGVTDLKAAIRYYRYNAELLPGDAESIFSFGMSGGGAQSALLGATGDSDLYTPYLEMIGAVQGVSDAVRGSMCWCPITNLDTADAAYEWNLGVTREGLSDTEQKLSDALAASYAGYINTLGLTDEEGTVLVLEESGDGIYQAGTYYEYIKGVVETSLEHFLADTEFPYDTSSASSDFGGFGGMRGHGGQGFGRPEGMGGDRPEGMGMPGGQGRPEGRMPGGNGQQKKADESQNADGTQDSQPAANADAVEGMTMPAGNADAAEEMEMLTADAEEAAQFAADGIGRTGGGSSSGLSISGTFETPQDYIDALNAEGEWVSYDAETGKVSITSVADFVKRLKNASKSLGAFDQLNRGQGENTLFGYGDGSGAHFDAALAEIVSELAAVSNDAELQEWTAAYEEDLQKTDAAGNTAAERLDMYTPMYYLSPSEEGYKTSGVAEFWRIRTGINQGDTALSTEVNLALALEAYEGVSDVDFETVWGKGHTKAERSGSSDENFIEWVNQCMAK